MKSKLERQHSDSSETSSRSNETPPKRKWHGRIQSKLSLALDTTNKTNVIDKLTARSDDSCSSGSSSSSDSALSCSSLESGEEEEVEDWFANDSEEIGENVSLSPSISSVEPEELWTSDSNVTSEYILDEKELYNQLRGISDLQFDTLDQKAQEELMRTVVKQDVPAGTVIIKEGDDDDGGCFYLVLASPPGSEVEAQVEVVRNVNGSEEFVTTLGPSQYFGQKFFLSNRTIRRNATVRAVTRTILGVVYPKDFYLWHKFRTFLLMKAVPLIRTLPQSEQLEMYSLLQHQEFADGEYIIRQGDVGDKFYIITDGSADVIEESFDGYHFRREVLTRLYEGHFFGEMAIIYDEPRVASVVAVGRTSCLYLSKAAFREALSTQQFHMMMQNVAYERTIVRERREKTHIAKLLSHDTSSSMSTLTEDLPLQSPSFKSVGPGMPYRLRRMSDSAAFQARSPRVSDSELSETGTPNEVTTTNVLVRKRLATGDKFINKYLIIRELGRGSFGGVYLVRDEETDKLYAMKVISKSAHKWNMNVTNEIKREIAIMKNLRHPNIVSLLEVIDDPSAKQVYLIQEYLEGGPLMPGEGIVGEPLPTDKTWVYFRDMLRGVSYLHSQGVVHRDLKPQNMLLTADDVLKIADFGAAVLTGGGAKVLAAGGTPAFMAPELFQTGLSESENRIVNSPQVDVWGLGATLYNMVFGRPPWMAANQIQLAEMVQKIELTFPKDKEFNIDPHLRHLLKRMLDKDPRTRITMSELGWHEWVTKEGSQPLDDDFDLASYDARDVNEVLISQAIPEFIGAIPLRRLSGSVTNVTEADHVRVLTQTPPLRGGNKNHSGTSSRSDPLEFHDHEYDALESDHHIHGKIIDSPSNRSVSSIGSFGFQPSGTRTPPGTGVASGVTDTLHRSAALLALVNSEGDEDVPILSNPKPKSLKNTKHQEFVARPTEIKLGDSGEVWKGVIMTNPKNRNENDLGFTWNSQNLKQKRRFGRSTTLSSDEANDSDHDDSSSHGMPTKSKSMNLSRSSSESSRSNPKSMKSKSTSTMHSPSKDNGRSHLPIKTELTPENLAEKNDLQTTAIKLLQNHDSMSLGSSETNTSDSEDEDVQLVMEMEPAGSNPGSRPRPLSLSSSKKLNDLCEYVSDDDIVSLDDDGLENMLDSLCAPSKENKRDAQLQPLTFDLRNQDTLQIVKTWAGQSNMRTGIRYGIAEITNGRDSMEDRTTAKASMEEEAKRQKEKTINGNPTASFHFDYLSKGRTEDFGFFGVYDGHDGSYVSEYLQNHLHLRFRQRLAINSMRGAGVKQSFLEAASLIDDEILRIDFERMKIAKEARVSMTSIGYDTTPPKPPTSNSSLPPVPPPINTSTSITSTREKGNKQSCSPNSGSNPDRRKGSSSLMKDGGAQSFAGSTAVIAIVYGGWPYETPTQSIEASPRNSTASSSSRRSSGNTNKSHISFNSSSHSLIHHDSFIKHALSGGSDLEVVPENIPNHPYPQMEHRREESIDLTELRSSLDDHVELNPPKPEEPPLGPRPPVKIFIAHVGDCRAVLCESGVAVQLTMDHSPKSAIEQERIEAAGGWVHNGRVNGVLGVSRSFGDIMYKNYLPEEKSSPPLHEGDIANVWQPHYQVVSLPETLELVIQPTHEFLVLASDGLWEKCSCVEVVNFVRRRLFEHGDVMRAAKEMVAKVESQGGSDNTSIIIICLNQLSKTVSPSKGGLTHPLRRMSASQSSSSLSAGSLSPNTSFTEENLRGLRRNTGSWRRAQSLARVNISPSCSFRVMNLSPSIQTRDRDDSA